MRILISIITVSYNAALTIEYALNSVVNQTYPFIEYLVIDGNSTDSTISIIEKYKNKISYFISEPDGGIYDAMNKGIKKATGEIIGFLNADDYYANNYVIEKIMSIFRTYNVLSCYGDLSYVKNHENEKIVRYWKSSPFHPGKFRSGWMPPHPTFFVKKDVYEKYGYFNTDLKIAADYEIMLRLLEKHLISSHYIPEQLVKMRVGGVSNRRIMNILKANYETYKSWRINNLPIHPMTFFLKPLSKIPQFFTRLSA